jgi:hypothetical protein
MNKIEALKALLREDRIKHGVDYAILHKYGKTRVLCDEVWRQSIEAVAAKIELPIDDWHTY